MPHPATASRHAPSVEVERLAVHVRMRLVPVVQGLVVDRHDVFDPEFLEVANEMAPDEASGARDQRPR